MNSRLMVFHLLIVVLIARPVTAHHSTFLSYDLTHDPITLKGSVTEFRWQNPHVQIFLDVKDSSGKVVNWRIDGTSVIVYASRGFSRNTLKAGDEITALVYPSRVPNRPVAVVAKIILPTGQEVLRFQRDTPGSAVD